MMDSALAYVPLARVWNVQPDEPWMQLEAAVHEMVHLFLCDGDDLGRVIEATLDADEINDLIEETYTTTYQRDVHEVRTSLITAWVLKELNLPEIPSDIEHQCFHSARGNLIVLDPTNAETLFLGMKDHKTNRARAKLLAQTIREEAQTWLAETEVIYYYQDQELETVKGQAPPQDGDPYNGLFVASSYWYDDLTCCVELSNFSP